MRKRRQGPDFTKVRYRRSRKGAKEAVVILLFLLLLAGMGIFGIRYWKELQNEKPEENPEGTITVTPMLSPVADENRDPDMRGPYGLWTQPTQPVSATPVPEDEIWMADFVDTRVPTNVKGIYVTSDAVNNKLDTILEWIDSTELNTIVIDVKDDDGRLTYMMSGKLIDEFGTARSFIPNMEKFMKTCKEHNIYMIARVVAFKDPLLVRTVPELGLHLKDGTVYKDNSRLGWLNPMNQTVLDYYVEIAQNIADIGFDEINFDYVRFPTEGKVSELVYCDDENVTKIDAITAAVKYLCEQIRPMGIYVSADLFGTVIRSTVDQRIVGQDYMALCQYLDYICPMIYPSHYSYGYAGIDYPDLEPYKIVSMALSDSNKVLAKIPEYKHRATVRPWLQDFTASYLKHYMRYGPEEIRAQINATYDSGQTQWMLWNAAVNYTISAMMTEEEADYEFAHRPTPTPTPTPEVKEPTKMPNSGQYIDSPWKK